MSSAGTVKFFDAKKGFGFIVCQDANQGDVFVHTSGITDGMLLNDGDQVTFDIQTSNDGRPRAGNVTGGTRPQMQFGNNGNFRGNNNNYQQNSYNNGGYNNNNNNGGYGNNGGYNNNNTGYGNTGGYENKTGGYDNNNNQYNNGFGGNNNGRQFENNSHYAQN